MPTSSVSFSGFSFDPATGELTGPSGAVRLGPQPSRVLSILIERRGALVTRAELKDAIWGDTVVEADTGLNTCIRQIRSALGDEAEQGRFIETLPRRGYRFVARIHDASIVPSSTVIGGASIAPTVAAKLASLRSRRRAAWAATTVLVVFAASAVLFAGATTNRNVAILPVKPLPTDPDWVRDVGTRITDQLVEKMTAHSPRVIGVVGPATTAGLVNNPAAHTELGKSLHVGFVLSGFVRPSDSTVFVQVVRVSDGVHLYAVRRHVFQVNIDSLTSEIVAGAANKMLKR